MELMIISVWAVCWEYGSLLVVLALLQPMERCIPILNLKLDHMLLGIASAKGFHGDFR